MSQKIPPHLLFSKLNHILWRNGAKICGSIYARDLLITLIDMESPRGIFPCDKSLAEINGVSSKTIQRARAELKSRNLIQISVFRTGDAKNRRIKYSYVVNHALIESACLAIYRDSKQVAPAELLDCESSQIGEVDCESDIVDCQSATLDCESDMVDCESSRSIYSKKILEEDIIRIDSKAGIESEPISEETARDYKRRQAIYWMKAKFYHWDRVRSLGDAAVNYIADTMDDWRPNGELNLDAFNEYFENAKAGAYEMATPILSTLR